MAEDIAPVPDLSDRVDALLSSALADQAREKRQFVDTLYGARAALSKAEEQIEALKDRISERDQELLEAVDKKFGARIEVIEEAILQLAHSVSAIPIKVRKDVEVGASALADRVGEESDSLLTNLREDAVEVVGTLSRISDRNLATVQHSIEAAREEYRTTTEQVVKYLGERDDALQRQRNQVLIALFKQLGESLGKRNARKVTKAFGDPEVGHSMPPIPEAPKKVPPPDSRPSSYRPPVSPQLGRGTSIVGPPERSQPVPFSAERPAEKTPPAPRPAPFDQEEEYDVVPASYEKHQPYQGEVDEEPEQSFGSRRPAGIKSESSDYLVRVPTFSTPEEKLQDRLAGTPAPFEPDPDAKPKRSRRKTSESPAGAPKAAHGAKVVKVPKSQAPIRRGSRRKPEP